MTPPSMAAWWEPAATSAAPSAKPGAVPSEGDAPSVADAEPRSRLAFQALIAFLFVLFVAPQEHWPLLAPLHLAQLAIAAAIAGYIFRRGRVQTRRATPREVTLALALVWWSALTIPFSYWPAGSLETLTGVYLKSLVVFWLVGTVVDTPARLRWLCWAVTLFSVPVAITGLVHFASGAFDSGRVVGYQSGLAGNPNDLALTLAIVLPLAIALAWSAHRRLGRWIALSAAALGAGAIVVTFSRGGFIALAVILLLAAIRLIRQGKVLPIAAALMLVLLALPLIPGGYVARLQTIASVDADPTGSAQNRWRDTVVAVQYVAHHPIVGAGIGMDYLALNTLRGVTWKSVHNAYLNYGVDLGLPGLILFGLLVVTAIRRVSEVERRACEVPEGAPLAAIAAGVRISLTAFAIAALFYPVAYYFYFYFVAGIGVAAGRIASSSGVMPASEAAPAS